MKNTVFKLHFIIILVFFSVKICAQSLTSTQIDRLFKTNQLWGHLKYFHPYLQYKNIPFDSAYAEAIPQILAAQSDEDFIKSLNNWLKILDDPATRAEATAPTQAPAFKFDFKIDDEYNIITLSGDLSDYMAVLEKMGSIDATSFNSAKGMVWDISDLQGDLDWVFEYSGIHKRLFTGNIVTDGRRSVAYSGFVPENGSTSGGYQTYFKLYPPNTLVGKAQKDIPCVFIVSEKTVIPSFVLALKQAGKAAIVVEGNPKDNSGSILYPLTEGVNIYFKIYENLSGALIADANNTSGNKAKSIDIAKDILLNNKLKPTLSKSDLPVALVPKTPTFPSGKYPSLGYRSLAAAKVYSVINYFFPNKKLMTVDWDSVSKTFLPQILAAKDSMEYNLAINAYYANIQDGHGFTYGSLVNKYFVGGTEKSAITGELIEGKYVITNIIDDSIAKVKNIKIGDIVTHVNGKNVLELISTLKKYKAHSNDVTGGNYAASVICAGIDNNDGVFTIQSADGKSRDIALTFSKKASKMYYDNSTGRAKQPLLRFLTPEIGYADLDRLEGSAVDSMFEMFKNTKAIVFDMRGYPQGTAWSIAPRLTSRKYVAAAKFTRLDVDFPKTTNAEGDVNNAETWTHFIQNIPNNNGKSYYKGQTVMLINENTQSQAEHTGLFFRAANGTKFIGSQTAGANGDVTNFMIPGGITLHFSGQTVWFPDGKQLQRTGLVPDILVRPTIKGIRAGKDEVLERAILYLKTGK